jgi:hypothetical protein
MLHLTFDVSELKRFFGRNLDHYFCIENPYCLYEKAKRDPKGLTLDMIARGLKDEFEKTAKILEEMISKMKKFEPVHTNDFIRLYEKKEQVEETILTTLAEYNNQTELMKKIQEEEAKLKAAGRTKSLNAKFESQVERTITEKTSRHNTLCGHPSCYSNCHTPCNLDKSFDKKSFLSCWCIVGENCRVCGHSYMHHYHNEVLFKKVKEPVIDPTSKALYDAAKTDEEKAKIAKEELQRQKIESEEKKKRLSEQLIAAIEEFQMLGISRSYLLLLQSQLNVIELYLEAEEGNKEYLQKTKEDLEKRIKIVKESIKSTK